MLDRTVPPTVQGMSFAFRKPKSLKFVNGIPLHVIEAAGQEVVRVDFVFSAGQWHQTQRLQALFTCRMLREGCGEYSSAIFAERLDYYGAWLELSVAMNRTFVTLYTLKKFFSETLSLVQCMLLDPVFPEEQFRTICANNKAQYMINIQKGDVLAMRKLRRCLYGDCHPCGSQTEADDYDRLHADHLREFYDKHFGSRSCSIYLSGSVDDAVVAQVESLFGKTEWGSGVPGMHRDYEIVPDCEKKHTILQAGAVQSSIRMGALLMDIKDEDYLQMRVLNTVLGGYFGSRLMRNIREEKGYTYHIASDLITNTSQVMFMVSSEALSDKTNEVVEEVCREMHRLQDEEVSEEELRLVRNHMIGEICRNYEGAFSLTDAYIFMEHLGLSQTHVEDMVEAVRVTNAARLQQLAQRYLNPDSLHTVVVCP